MDLDREFGARMRRTRTIRGLTQKDMAEAMNGTFGFGWHQTTCGKIESGERQARLTEALAIALVLNVGLEDLVFGGARSVEAVTAADRAYEELSRVQEMIEKQLLRLSMEATDVVVEQSRRRPRAQES